MLPISASAPTNVAMDAARKAGARGGTVISARGIAENEVKRFFGIEAWRREMSLRRTKKDRPDLFAKFEPQDKRDRKILEKIRQDG